MDIATNVTAGGIFMAAVSGALALIRIALGAERRRADDWRDAAKTSATTTQVLSDSVGKLVDSVDKLADNQRNLMAVVDKLADNQREMMAVLRDVARDLKEPG